MRSRARQAVNCTGWQMMKCNMHHPAPSGAGHPFVLGYPFFCAPHHYSLGGGGACSGKACDGPFVSPPVSVTGLVDPCCFCPCLQWQTVGDVDVDIGANPSAEDAEEGQDSSARKVIDIIESFRLVVSSSGAGTEGL